MINDQNKEKSYSLIVNYLPQTIKENELNDIFSNIGQLKSCKLMQDKQTGYSYGFAFIEYLNGEEHAKVACEKLNGLQIGQKTIRVTQARPQSNQTRNTKLYLKGFPNNFNQKNLENLFLPFGQIIQLTILKDKSIAFIIMSTRNQAQTAIDHLHGLQITPSNTLYVKFSDNHSPKHTISSSLVRPISFNQSSPNIIYVYGLSQSIRQAQLSHLFSEFGMVTRVDIIMDPNTGLSKGYGFILMNNYSDALRAIEQLNNSFFHGKYLQVRFKNSSNMIINY